MSNMNDMTGLGPLGPGTITGTGPGSPSSQSASLERQIAALQKTFDQLLEYVSKGQGGGAAGAGAGGGQKDYLDFMREMMKPLPGSVTNPLAASAMMQSSMPGNGPYVQSLGGMPPGYNDSVAKTLSATATGGNLLSQMFSTQGGQENPLIAALKGMFGRKPQ